MTSCVMSVHYSMCLHIRKMAQMNITVIIIIIYIWWCQWQWQCHWLSWGTTAATRVPRLQIGERPREWTRG